MNDFCSISIFSLFPWFSPVYSTNKTDRHEVDITEILLKVVLNTIDLVYSLMMVYWWHNINIYYCWFVVSINFSDQYHIIDEAWNMQCNEKPILSMYIEDCQSESETSI
jgi:hypothetical protein